ncbi:hypothetical protein BCN13_25010 [Salmonella enterica]|nr:hypothetical protein [Salmonella enterica]EAO7618934.1 hypothetical protein [Salmonella enterica]EAQ6819273.1 hypothetical protein [Salmonella enterica]
MEKNKLSLVILGCAFLSSCVPPPPPPKTTIVDTRTVRIASGSDITILTQNAINGDVIKDTDNRLNIVSKADNAKAIGLVTLQFAAMLLGGGSGRVAGYSKEQLKGIHIDSVKNKTMTYLNPELDAILEKIPTSGKDIKITVEPYKFKLIYDGLDNNNYEFIYSTTISSGNFHQLCSGNYLTSSERIQPIDTWERNNYELTQIMAKKIIKNCFEDINHAENLAKLANAVSGEENQREK